jgi:hypothetical protein
MSITQTETKAGTLTLRGENADWKKQLDTEGSYVDNIGSLTA